MGCWRVAGSGRRNSVHTLMMENVERNSGAAPEGNLRVAVPARSTSNHLLLGPNVTQICFAWCRDKRSESVLLLGIHESRAVAGWT